MGHRTKKDVEAAYIRGFKNGYDEAMKSVVLRSLRVVWRRRQLKQIRKKAKPNA